MIQANKISLSYGEQVVFDNVSFTINQYERIGLVGRNGSGKTTLLKAIAQQESLDKGSITVASNKTIAYMPQEIVLLSEKSVIDETLTTFEKLHALQTEAAQLEDQIANNPNENIIERYAAINDELSQINPAAVNAEAQQVLAGLGFNKEQLSVSVNTLSVGWKMRIVLAKLLLKNADFYLFDEPTNHLDIIAKDWFLDFLRESSFGFILVCHERYFLDHVVSEILDLELGKATFYTGNYSTYQEQKEHDMDLLIKAHNLQQKEIKRKMETINRFRASASKAKMAQSMLRAVEKIELITIPPSAKDITFSFPPLERPGKTVLTVNDVSYQFGSKKIFKNAHFSLEREEKVAIIAPNGIGKTTLFNIIAGKLSIQTGMVEFGHNVSHAIFAQDQNKILSAQKTVLENVESLCPKVTQAKIRSFLGAFLLSGDDVYKKANVLSGGEKNRVGMVIALLQNANLLLLDEPTNHLDIPSKEILLNALLASSATILFVSHDHDFVNRLATRIIELSPLGTHSYMGNYESYLYQKKHEASGSDENKKTVKEEFEKKKTDVIENNKDLFEQNKQIKKSESRIDKLEREIEKLEKKFEQLVYGTEEFFQSQKSLTQLNKELEKTIVDWEKLHQ